MLKYSGREQGLEVDLTRPIISQSRAQCRFLGGQHSGVQVVQLTMNGNPIQVVAKPRVKSEK